MFLESFESQIKGFSRQEKKRLSHQSNPLIRVLKKIKKACEAICVYRGKNTCLDIQKGSQDIVLQ